MIKTGLIVGTVLKNCMQDPQAVFKSIGPQEAFDLNTSTRDSREVLYFQVDFL